MSRSLRQLIDAQIGTPTRAVENPLISEVGTTAQQALNLNPNRVAFSVTNLSANNVYMAPTNEVSATRGYFLGPNGGSIVFLFNEDFDLVGLPWFVLATSSSSAIFVQELLTT